MEDLTTAFGEAVTKCNDLAIACKEGWQTNGIDGMLDAVRQTTPELSILVGVVQGCIDNGKRPAAAAGQHRRGVCHL